jgi:hypothetical protein
MSQTPPPPAGPRWVKVFGVIFILLVGVVVAMHLAGVDFGSTLHHMP